MKSIRKWITYKAPGFEHVKIHNDLWFLAIILMVIEGILFGLIPTFNIFTFSFFYIIFYYLGENYIGCDSDLIGMTQSDGQMLRLKKKNFFLGLLGLFYLILNLIYGWMIPSHRHFLSHSVFVSTIIRIIWFIVIPLFTLLNYIGTLMNWKITEYYFQFYGEFWIVNLLLAAFCAMSFADILHLIMDSESAKNVLYDYPAKKKEK